MNTSSDVQSNPVVDVLTSHVSVRRFTTDEVAEETVDVILDAARRAPTSSNWQTYSIIVIRDPEKKARLAELAGGQRHIEQCSVFLAFCADVHRLKQATAQHGEMHARGLDHTITPIVDATIVGEATQIAAESFGLGAVMVGGMRRDPTAVAEVLGLPPEVFVVFGMSVGWPEGDDRAAGLKPRLPKDLVVHHDEYSDEGAMDLIEQYNRDLADFYEARGRNLDPDAWSGPVTKGARQVRYQTLRDDLEALGFSFD